jgi:hypothetical protein
MLLVLLSPAVTMRLLSEEKRAGTLEPLMTAPVTDFAVVMGKYLAALVFFLILWLPGILFLVLVMLCGGRFDHLDVTRGRLLQVLGADQRLREAADGRERRPQIVGGKRDEFRKAGVFGHFGTVASR